MKGETKDELLLLAQKATMWLSERLRAAWNNLLEDEVLRLLLGVFIALFGAVIDSLPAVSFGLGAAFTSAIAILGRRRLKRSSVRT